MTQKEQWDLALASRRLADTVLELAQSTQRQQLILDRIRQDLHELTTSQSTLMYELRHELTQIRERLAVISSDVDGIERDVTSKFKTQKSEEGHVQTLVGAFKSLPPRERMLTMVLLSVICLTALFTVGDHLFSILK